MTRLVRLVFGLVFCASIAGASGLTYTCDSSVDASAPGTCAYLNTTIAGLYNSTFTNASADIYIEQGRTGLAGSEAAESFIPYSAYLSALTSTASGDGVDTAALAALNTLDTAVYGSDNVVITSALAGALGFTAVGGLTASGANCTIGAATGCYSGIIIVTTPAYLSSQQPGESLYYRQSGGSITSGAFDYYSLVERETDEVLGTISCISTTGGTLSDHCDAGTGAAAGTGTPSAEDLFRYNGVGNLALDNASLGSGSAPAGAYFSFDGGVTNGAGGAVYNTAANNQDYADFTASCTWVQTAAGCLGKSLNITTDGNAEKNILDAVGYNLAPAPVPEPGTLALFGAGLAIAGARSQRFRKIFKL
jgi:PEP-CTERM motif